MAFDTSDPPARVLPVINQDSRPFWTGGRLGQLLIARCDECLYFVHPPVPFCPRSESRQVSPVPVSGRGRVLSFSINHKAWIPGLPSRYVLALIELAEQPDVRLVSNIVGCAPEEVSFGMEVEVLFEQVEDLWVPLFRSVGQ